MSRSSRASGRRHLDRPRRRNGQDRHLVSRVSFIENQLDQQYTHPHADRPRHRHLSLRLLWPGRQRGSVRTDYRQLAVEAAATGHLVFGTLHTENAAKTVDRIIEVFPAAEQPQIRNTLSTALRVVVAQNLFKRIDQKGRCAALEILVCTPAVSNLIRDAKTVQIASQMQTGKNVGMQTLDDAIQDLLTKKWISPEEAYEKCIDKNRFAKLLKTPPDALQ
ncbi:MAG: Flp pilus assembly complex ATPase component TadA [Nitrospira sp.]|nr:Flp pilus assembly complex ATPase component TadA [Nitrospira sp.]